MRRRRLVAFVIDWCCMFVWIGIVAAVGIPLYLHGTIGAGGQVGQNVIGLTVVAPIVIAAAWCESRERAATIGKRALRLVVQHGAGRPTFARALLRNVLKLGVPWLVAHAAVFALVDPSTREESWVVGLLIGSYVLPVLWLITFFLPGARTLYDRLSSTRVTRCVPAGATTERP